MGRLEELQSELLLAKAKNYSMEQQLAKQNKVATKGAIICGYPGIGKTTLSRKLTNCIDLESSLFKLLDSESPWYIRYCEIAVSLAAQGNIVFVSSHSDVQKQLIKYADNGMLVFVCYPSLELEQSWIDKLYKRYRHTQLSKDKAALVRALTSYVNDIKQLSKCPLAKIEIKTAEYDLLEVFDSFSIWSSVANV